MTTIGIKTLGAPALTRCAEWLGLVLVLTSFTPWALLAEDAGTVLGLDGQIRPLTIGGLPPLSRHLLAEDGVLTTVDEYAVVDASGKVAYASPGFPATLDSDPAIGRTPSMGPILIIEHQYVHEHNDRYSLTPTATFNAYRVAGRRSKGQRGFAVITIGQTGQVMGVKVISPRGEIRDYELYEALASGIATSFPDRRRHDHTVYLAYEVRAGVVRQVGASFVTMPFCGTC